jgi:hypothetical protein
MSKVLISTRGGGSGHGSPNDNNGSEDATAYNQMFASAVDLTGGFVRNGVLTGKLYMQPGIVYKRRRTGVIVLKSSSDSCFLSSWDHCDCILASCYGNY